MGIVLSRSRNTFRWLLSRAPTQAEAFVGGSSRLKFCSAIRSGSHLIGRFSRAATQRTCEAQKDKAQAGRGSEESMGRSEGFLGH